MAENVFEWKLGEFIDKAASKSPTPGGGNVSSVVGALGAAMVCMVANLTLGKKGYEEHQDKVKEIIPKLEGIIAKLKELTAKDMEVFEEVVKAWRMPRETEEEKKKREEAIEEVTKKATMVPLEMCRACLEGLEIAKDLATYGNKSAISDVGVGAYLLLGALKGAMFSVDINLGALKDQEFKKKVEEERAKILGIAEELAQIAVVRTKERL